MKRGIFKTRRLILKAITSKDYDAWFDAYVNRRPTQSKWDSGPLLKKKCSRSAFRKLMRRLEQLANTDDYYRYSLLSGSERSVKS
jgi:[ribosomal protein S5]-alanine N-acetyltransferase